MRGWLSAMPDSVMPLLTKNNRLDFIDFYDAKMEAVVTNRMSGKSRMHTLTNDFVQIEYTASADVSMKLLYVNDTTDVLCMVTTMRRSVDDSRIAFYDAQWQPLDVASYFVEPCMKEFRSTMQSDSVQWAWSKVDIFFRTYELCAESSELKCVFTSLEYLSKEDREEVTPYVIQESLTCRWDNGKYLLNE
jgi:hypothetical protein